ncbi:MAG: hypothetical protein AAGF83_14145 [Cyanobacteria bacterium P01_G01_bin.67]
MAENRDNWWKSWLKPGNIIALGSLIVAIWGGYTFLSNRQNVDAKKNCEVKDITQKTGSKENLGQSVVCSDDSKIEGVTQE